MQRAALELDDRVHGVADALGQLQIARAATFAAPALQGLGADTLALGQFVLVDFAVFVGRKGVDRLL